VPLGVFGALLAVLLRGMPNDVYFKVGLIAIIGLSSKNAILIIEFARTLQDQGRSLRDAILEACRLRLRPILMTSFAMIAGTLPLALGLGEAAKQRTAMGIAIIGGLVISTIMTLVFVPAGFGYIDRLREWIEKRFRPDYDMSLVGANGHDSHISMPNAEEQPAEVAATPKPTRRRSAK